MPVVVVSNGGDILKCKFERFVKGPVETPISRAMPGRHEVFRSRPSLTKRIPKSEQMLWHKPNNYIQPNEILGYTGESILLELIANQPTPINQPVTIHKVGVPAKQVRANDDGKTRLANHRFRSRCRRCSTRSSGSSHAVMVPGLRLQRRMSALSFPKTTSRPVRAPSPLGEHWQLSRPRSPWRCCSCHSRTLLHAWRGSSVVWWSLEVPHA